MEVETDQKIPIVGQKSPKSLRLQKLQTTLDRSLGLVGEDFSFDMMKKTFPELSAELGDRFRDFYNQLYSLLINTTQDDFSSILIEYDMEKKCAELDKLVFEAKQRVLNNEEKIQNLSPELEFTSIVYPSIQKTNEKLKQQIEEQDQKNELLLREFENKKAELEKKIKYLSTVHGSSNKSNT
ncbi:hypothetical protein BB560_005179 [Smittium megazygosporum]|uniref:Uncharacterized protein n=1 Tax=Smittium megazygosporum TaxID=133381 RepID=A0A2T9Z7D0_9FUNG|nr:hypothetical protein BB560_005179 [Smittium megazygosporum]